MSYSLVHAGLQGQAQGTSSPVIRPWCWAGSCFRSVYGDPAVGTSGVICSPTCGPTINIRNELMCWSVSTSIPFLSSYHRLCLVNPWMHSFLFDPWNFFGLFIIQWQHLGKLIIFASTVVCLKKKKNKTHLIPCRVIALLSNGSGRQKFLLPLHPCQGQKAQLVE